MNESLFIALQRLAPQHLISRVAGAVASSEIPLIKNSFIRWFHNKYQVDMNQALEQDPLAYPSFNEFFTRALRADARPIQGDEQTVACPADGVLSQFGEIEQGRIIQAKGQSFTVAELLAEANPNPAYQNGQFATVYLSPRDYHRVHMPVAGTLTQMTHVPGRLFSVNSVTTEHVPRLFARNERVICHFDTAYGPMVVVLVGAMIVAGIETVWAGRVAPVKRRVEHRYYNQQDAVHLERGEELGRFYLGSTVVVLMPEGRSHWPSHLSPGSFVIMGEPLLRMDS